MADPILNLDQLALSVHANITIDGVNYPLKTDQMASIVEIATFNDRSKRMKAYFDRIEELSVEEATTAAALLDEICRSVLDAPDDVHQKLKDRQRLRICEAFMRLPALDRPAQGASTPTQAPSSQVRRSRKTGLNSSRNSSASTAAVPGNG